MVNHSSKLLTLKKLNLDKLRQRCLAPIASFGREGESISEINNLFFQDNGADILGVAHLDSVQMTEHFQVVAIKPTGGEVEHLVYNGQLDDRFGAYMLLDYLPSIGLKFDVLLTDDEESCRSTAMYFDSEKKYNWMFSFDREGSAAVAYQYTAKKKWTKALRSAGFRVKYGSYSDICDLGHLGCCGVNIGTGLSGGHSAFASIDVMTAMYNIQKFVRFYKKNASRRFGCKAETRHRFSQYDTPYNMDAWEAPHTGGTWEICELCYEVLYMEDEIRAGVCSGCAEQDTTYCFCGICGEIAAAEQIIELTYDHKLEKVCVDCLQYMHKEGVV